MKYIVVSFENGLYTYRCNGYHYETKIFNNLVWIMNLRHSLKRFIRIPLINKYIFF